MTNLALFDLDHTLIPTDSDHEWGRFMVKLGIVDAESFSRQNDRFYADYKAGTLDIHAYLTAMLTPLAQYPRAKLTEWHDQYMHEVIRPAMLPAALALVRQHQDAGDLCCIVTATNSFITRPIATAFGVEALIACEVETVDGHPASDLTGRPTGEPSFREGKITRTEAWLAAQGKTLADFERSWFYSDSHNDIPLLAKVTDPVATNPDDTLRAHAREHGWRILDLFQPS
ncbi:MAG: Phosphoserine phosphatase SerB1 [Burkholderia plantarii]|nr:MAG: Phosphoserine phosphatase SerB1 [Burkholderia plantarii]